MALPTSHKRAVFKEAGGPLTIEQTALIPPTAGEVLVKVEACGVCFSDHIAQSYGMRGSLYVILHTMIHHTDIR
jgi:Zn-dependent alcohol dehydrogenase